jgi:hypothetical protein
MKKYIKKENKMSDTKQELLDIVLDVVKQLESNMDPVEFLDSCLSVETIKKSIDGTWKGAEVLYGYGGPNIWIDTQYNTVTGYWGSDQIERSYEDNIGLDDTLYELYGI